VIEQAILTMLRSDTALMALLGNDPARVDLVDVAQGTTPPYLTFTLASGARMGRGNLCDPTALGLLSQQLMVTPWAPTAPAVHAINVAARAALLCGLQTVGTVRIDSITWQSYHTWAREPETNLLTRGQTFAVQHTE